MFYKSLTLFVSLGLLFSCGGGDSGSSGAATSGGGNASQGITANLSSSSWQTGCSTYHKFAPVDDDDPWNVRSTVKVDSSLEATFKTEFFHPTDTTCKSAMFDTLNIIKFQVKGTVTTDESIQAYKLDERYIYSSEDNMPEMNYTVIYHDAEKIYFGKPTGDNLGATPETRHNSISLADYYQKKIN